MQPQKKTMRASIIELYNRVIPINTNDKVYMNETDNLYPNRIERIINNSPTASRCASLFAKFIIGDGLEDPTKNVIVNKKKNYKITDVISLAANDTAYQYGVFFHVGYGADFKINTVDVLNYTKCRISKEDDNGNFGKIYYKDFEKQQYFLNKEKTTWFYPFNQNKDVVLSQMKADSLNAKNIEELVKGYRGQVYYLNFTPQYIYALSLIDSVYNDADTEYRLSLYVNKQMRTGFLDQTIVITQGIDEELDNTINSQLKQLMGADNTGNLMHLSTPIGSEIDLEKSMVVKQIPSSFKPELLEKIGSRLKTNILGQFNNIPEALVSGGDGALFGTNSETYSKMKDFYSEQTAHERKMIEKTLQMFGFDIKIKPISGAKISSFEENNLLKLKGQAELRSSVGGNQILIQIVQNVANQTLDLNSAIAMLEIVHGYSTEDAKRIIGTPNQVIIEPQNTIQ
jgi:hypothetical protein